MSNTIRTNKKRKWKAISLTNTPYAKSVKEYAEKCERDDWDRSLQEVKRKEKRASALARRKEDKLECNDWHYEEDE